jgi:nucleoside-diphosphate-sugar epimerase
VLVFGPIIHDVVSLEEVNVSAHLVRDLITGEYKNEIPESQLSRWVDVRDSALAHVRAIEVDEAGGKRFFASGGTYSNREVADILWKHFPALRHKLPGPEVKSGGYPAAGVSKCDTELSRKILGVEYMSLEDSIVSMAGSLVGLYQPEFEV